LLKFYNIQIFFGETSIDYQLCVWKSQGMVTWPFTFNCKKTQVQEEKDKNKNGLGQMGSPTMYKNQIKHDNGVQIFSI
jgi:hypothetical protein